MSRAWSIPGAGGQAILGDAHIPASEPVGVLIICHGFKGYKDYGFLPHLADAACAAGLIAHRFNFSHSGMTRRIETFERPDLFEQDTWGRQIADLTAVTEAIRAGRLEGGNLPLVVFGHSRGGVTALLSASRGLEVAGLIAAASPDYCSNLDDDQKAMLRRRGYLISPSSRTGQDLRIGRAWQDEIDANPAAFDPRRAAAALQLPMLLIHGDADETVPVARAKSLAQASDFRAELVVIPGAGHTFNAANPMQTPPPVETQLLFEAAVSFALRISAGA
jgi:alpha-beta hydrolase superfamily lysophospholipase